jgi:hypothetical protein
MARENAFETWFQLAKPHRISSRRHCTYQCPQLHLPILPNTDPRFSTRLKTHSPVHHRPAEEQPPRSPPKRTQNATIHFFDDIHHREANRWPNKALLRLRLRRHRMRLLHYTLLGDVRRIRRQWMCMAD